jgi:hypothetical protein
LYAAFSAVVMSRCAFDASTPFALKMHVKPPSEMMVALAVVKSIAIIIRARSGWPGLLRGNAPFQEMNEKRHTLLQIPYFITACSAWVQKAG